MAFAPTIAKAQPRYSQFVAALRINSRGKFPQGRAVGRDHYRFNAFWPTSATTHTITTVIAAAKTHSLAVIEPLALKSGEHYKTRPPAETKSFQIAAVHREEHDLERLQFTSCPNAVRCADFRPALPCGEAVENVPFGSKAEIGLSPVDVCFTPKSGHWTATVGCPLCANNGHRAMLRRRPLYLQ
jgi:hypothetical protein